jgi:hypothetical protein
MHLATSIVMPCFLAKKETSYGSVIAGRPRYFLMIVSSAILIYQKPRRSVGAAGKWGVMKNLITTEVIAQQTYGRANGCRL